MTESALDRLRKKDVLTLTPLEWCIILADRQGQMFEAVFDAAEMLEELNKKAGITK